MGDNLPEAKSRDQLLAMWTEEGYGPSLVFQRQAEGMTKILGAAPRFTCVDLATLVHFDQMYMKVESVEMINVLDQIFYRVIGWDPERGALILALAKDTRKGVKSDG